MKLSRILILWVVIEKSQLVKEEKKGKNFRNSVRSA